MRFDRLLVGLLAGLADQLGGHEQIQQLQGVIGRGGLQRRHGRHQRRYPPRLTVALELRHVRADPVAGQLR
jgi:hypothetical protein